MFPRSTIVSCFLLLLFSSLRAEEGVEVLRCAFDGATHFTGEGKKDELPANCANNYEWGKKDIDLLIDRDGTGNPAQLAQIRSISSGEFQYFVKGFSVWRTKYYRVSFRMRAENFQGSVSAQVRKIPGPWTVYVKGITFFPTDEWQTYTFSGKSNGDADADFGVMLGTGGVGNLWIDDVVVEEFLTDPDAARADRKPVSGNLIPRSSFEGESDYFWCSTYYPKENIPDGFMEDPQIYRAEGGKFGTYCLALPTMENPGTVSLRSYQFPVCPGGTYAFSFWGRNDTPDAEITADIYASGTNKRIVGRRFSLSAVWERHEQTVTIPEGVTDVYLSLSGKDGWGTHYLDGFSFRLASDKPGGEYEPAYPYELCVSTSQKRGNLFAWGEEIPLTLYCGSAAEVSENANIRATLRVTGYPDKVLQESPVELPVNAPLSVTLNPGRNGLLRIELIPNDAMLAYPQEIVAAVLPEPRPTGEDSFFGGHITINPYFINYAKRIGLKWIRLHDAGVLAKWSVSQPEKGEYRWHDRQVDELKENGLFILGLPDDSKVPAWASGENATPGNVINLDAFREHCKALAAHYAGKIDHWEIWNEPWMKYFFHGTPEQFRAVCIAGATGIHEGNPNAKTLGICPEIGGRDFVEKVGEEVWKPLDILSFHMYFQNITGNGKYSFADELGALKKTIGPDAPAQAWNSEGTLGDAGSNSFYRFLNVDPKLNEMAVAFSGRMWMESAKSGIAKTFIYTLHQSDTFMYYGGLKMLVGFDRSVTPAAASMAVCAWCIDGLTVTPCAEVTGAKQAFFQGADRQVWSVYDDPSAPGLLRLDLKKLPEGCRVLDVMGNDPRADGAEDIPVGIDPVYILVAPTEENFADRCAGALRTE